MFSNRFITWCFCLFFYILSWILMTYNLYSFRKSVYFWLLCCVCSIFSSLSRMGPLSMRYKIIMLLLDVNGLLEAECTVLYWSVKVSDWFSQLLSNRKLNEISNRPTLMIPKAFYRWNKCMLGPLHSQFHLSLWFSLIRCYIITETFFKHDLQVRNYLWGLHLITTDYWSICRLNIDTSSILDRPTSNSPKSVSTI